MADEKPHIHVEFYLEPVENPKASREAGRPIFEDQEFVRVRIAGDPKNSLISPAHVALGVDQNTGETITYAKKFPEHYRYFKSHETNRVVGTPLGEVPWLTASKVKELQALQIMTVEALAALDGTLLQRIGMGARELKNQAVAWLDKAAATAGNSQLATELAASQEQIAALQREIEAMKAGGVAPVVPDTEPEAETGDNAGDLGEESPFWAWDDPDIKNWIKDNGGTAPSGNASHKTIVARADALNTELAERQKQAA